MCRLPVAIRHLHYVIRELLRADRHRCQSIPVDVVFVLETMTDSLCMTLVDSVDYPAQRNQAVDHFHRTYKLHALYRSVAMRREKMEHFG